MTSQTVLSLQKGLSQFTKGFSPNPGDAERAAIFARQLLLLGAEASLRSRWTNMSALHYAAYFDVPQLIRVVLEASQPGGELMGEGE